MDTVVRYIFQEGVHRCSMSQQNGFYHTQVTLPRDVARDLETLQEAARQLEEVLSTARDMCRVGHADDAAECLKSFIRASKFVCTTVTEEPRKVGRPKKGSDKGRLSLSVREGNSGRNDEAGS